MTFGTWLNSTILKPINLELHHRETLIRWHPWEEQEFRSWVAQADGKTQLDMERLWTLKEGLLATLNIEGRVGEFGVYRGGTAVLLASLLKEHDIAKQLHLFDSFAGGADTSGQTDPAKFTNTSSEMVGEAVEATGQAFEVHAGLFSETLPDVGDQRWSFAHVDANLYSSTKEVLDYLEPRMQTGGLIVFDDFAARRWPGVRTAVEEFANAVGRKAIHLTTGQALIVWQ